jgi:hypothetical protein
MMTLLRFPVLGRLLGRGCLVARGRGGGRGRGLIRGAARLRHRRYRTEHRRDNRSAQQACQYLIHFHVDSPE